MSAPVVLSSEADQDLVELFSLVAADCGVDRAEMILRRIEATIAALADWPGIGRLRHDLDGAPRGFAVPPWLIIYEAQPHDCGIYVWRIIDGRRDLTGIIHPPDRT